MDMLQFTYCTTDNEHIHCVLHVYLHVILLIVMLCTGSMECIAVYSKYDQA